MHVWCIYEVSTSKGHMLIHIKQVCHNSVFFCTGTWFVGQLKCRFSVLYDFCFLLTQNKNNAFCYNPTQIWTERLKRSVPRLGKQNILSFNQSITFLNIRLKAFTLRGRHFLNFFLTHFCVVYSRCPRCVKAFTMDNYLGSRL